MVRITSINLRVPCSPATFAGFIFRLMSFGPFPRSEVQCARAIETSAVVGPFTSMPWLAETPSDRNSPAYRPFGVAEIIFPMGT
jgi:hypothetical protein